MRQLAVSFGLGLQLVNIIKDATEDSGRKVCFIPMVWLRAAGFDQPQRLFAAEVDQTARAQAVQRMIDKAWSHLQDACNYTMLIPLLEPRLRLFCEWPLLMAAETLAAVQTSGSALFDPEHKVKIGRDAVARIVKHSSLWCWRPAWLPNRFVKLHNRSRLALPAATASP
jgi:farnesyl-diphosphate farnesyltransferase